MVLTMSTLALLAPGLKAVTWAWFSFKAIKLACKLGKSIKLVAKKGHQPLLPRFQSGKVEKFYNGKYKSKRSRPRFSKNKDKLAARKMETSVENKMSECHKPLMEEAEEDRIIKSLIITNFTGCNDNCVCNNVTGDVGDFTLAVPEDLTTIAEDAKELDSKYTGIKERNYTTINDSLDSSGEESQYILEPSLKDILETPVKRGNNRREFETLRNSSSALEAAGEMEVDVVEACILVECTTPLPVWTKVSDSGIPSWNKQLLPMDEQALENPVIPPKVDLSLMRYLDSFEKEEMKPKTIETAEMADDFNISLGVSYDLISVDSTGEVQTDDDSGEIVENSTAMSICSLNQSQSEGVMSGSLISPSILGSPDTSSNEGTPCSSRGARTKKSSQNIVPVQIKEILKSTDEAFQVEGMAVGIVIVSGRVVSIISSATKTTLIVDDQSGQIEVVHWIDKDSRKKEAWSKGSLIKVFGNVRSRRDQAKKYVMAFKIRGIPTEAEMQAHLLDVVHSHLKIKQLNNEVGGGLSNSMMGFNQTGGQSYGLRNFPVVQLL